jgi:hypothetical protein
MTQALLDLAKNLDRTIKLVLGIWGCLIAPLMIWAGLAVMIAETLGLELGLANAGLMGLELFLVGLFWEIVIYFTFIDN